MPPFSFTISSLSLGFTAFSEQAWWKVKNLRVPLVIEKSSNKENFASIRNQKLGVGNGFPSRTPDSLAPWPNYPPLPSALVGTSVRTLQGVASAWQRSIVQKLTSFYGLLIDRFTTMLLT